MSMSVATRYALRSLARHARRTVLSVLGIGLGCAACLFLVSFVRGEGEVFMRAAAESGTGHLQIVPKSWLATRPQDARLDHWQEQLKALRARADVRVATPRASHDGLLAFGTRLQGVRIVGVDPATEQASNRLVRHMAQGRYLRPGDTGKVVVGQAIATRLDVELGDDLMVTLADRHGEMKGDMLRIVGIVSTGSRELDASVCHVSLTDLERLTGCPGPTRLVVILKDRHAVQQAIEALRATVPAGAALVTWKEIMPELAGGVQVDETWTRMIVTIMMLVVFLGIASAQLAAVLERRREFAVLAALGMKGQRLVHIMLTEGLILGVAGGLLGLAIGLPSTYLHARWGIDFGDLMRNMDLTISNILIEPINYGDFGWYLVPLGLGLALVATLLSSLYPAWYATRTDPAEALRVEG